MARKKKKVEVVETATSTIQSLSYQGKIKLQIMHGNKVISTKNCFNSGLPSLFKYISHALAGVQYSALRPCKLAIFNCKTKIEDGGIPNPSDFNWDTATSKNILKAVSPYIAYDASPVVKATKENSSTIFRFKVPFNWLYAKEFNVLGLFTEDNTACAYYLFTKEDTTTDPVQKVWDPEQLNDVTGNFSLIIEWTMEISNK